MVRVTHAAVASVVSLVTCLSATAVLAQAPDDILTYTGPERTQRLIEGAKREGRVTYYSGMIVNQALRPLTTAFQKKYPFIKMAHWRADSEDILTRVSAEMRANNLVADVIEGTGVGELAVRAGVAQPIWSSQLADIPDYMRDPRRLWAPTRMSYFGIAYNTRLVPAGTEPKSYADLLDAKWKGKMAWPALTPVGAPLFVTNLRLSWGEDKAMAYLRQLRTQGIVNFGAGNPRTLVDRVIAGEYAIAIQIFAHHPLISAGKGAPVAAQLLAAGRKRVRHADHPQGLTAPACSAVADGLSIVQGRAGNSRCGRIPAGASRRRSASPDRTDRPVQSRRAGELCHARRPAFEHRAISEDCRGAVPLIPQKVRNVRMTEKQS